MRNEQADEIEKISGWRPPVIYDASTDQFRLATQADIDRLMTWGRAYGDVREHVRQIEELHAATVASVRAIV